MTKIFLEEQKKKLEQKKQVLENELSSFAKKDPNIKGNWESKFPNLGVPTADASEAADRVEEYEATLPIEHTLEIELQKVNNALTKMSKKKYGICENCNKNIEIARLKAYPEAELCIKCGKT